MRGWMYILRCSDGSFYTGSTNNLEFRLWQHNEGFGAIYTRSRRPVNLIYCEEFERIKDAYFREKQVQGWSRKKKFALIEGRFEDLIDLSKAKK